VSFEKVDPKDIATIVAKGNTPPKRQKSAATVDTSVRDHATWFKLRQTFGDCSNEDCIDPRIIKNGGDKNAAMVSNVNGKDTCRYCFLEGYLL
jgi:hypothetical protein